jgi:protein-tyrosine phosphatase
MHDPMQANAELGDGKAQAMFSQAYRDMVSLQSAKVAYRNLFLSLSDPAKLPALFHCTTGKDRTGWAAASLLSLLGVPRETVMQDFLRSNDYILPAYKPLIDKFVAEGGNPAIAEAILGVKQEYLEASFDEVDERHGSIENYFAEALGMDANAQKRLKDIFVDKATPP